MFNIPFLLFSFQSYLSRRKFLPEYWSKTVAQCDLDWISKALFTPDGKLKESLPCWHYPPEPPKSGRPVAAKYFLQRLFLWMPRRMWRVKLFCIKCKDKELTSKGTYKKVRKVVDIDSQYYLATEYLECSRCKKTYLPWLTDILNQLDLGHRKQFPCILSFKLACDLRVITMLRSRTAGNSTSLVQHTLDELHSESYLKNILHYLSDCELYAKKFAAGIQNSFAMEMDPFTDPPQYTGMHSSRWLATVYSNDILQRLDEVKAQITSVYGSILKMDSTKKVMTSYVIYHYFSVLRESLGAHYNSKGG